MYMSDNFDYSNRKILCVDDDPAALKLLEKILQAEGFEVKVAESGSKAMALVDDWCPHLVLLDVNMPGVNGIETLRTLRRRNEYVSVIFLSANDEKEDIVRGLDSGADDYVCKPYDPFELIARIRCQIRIKKIRDDLQVANGRLKELVDIDDLTGLFNMRSIYSKLDFELNRARRHKRSVAVVMMDMDHFKDVNDNNDHLFGSYVLSQIGEIIKKSMRKVDFAARYGGDEFLIVLSEIHLEGARTFAERLRLEIEKTIFSNEEYSKKLTASIGLAITDKGDIPFDGRTLVRYADKALYDAKESGRNCVRHYDFANEVRLDSRNDIQPATLIAAEATVKKSS